MRQLYYRSRRRLFDLSFQPSICYLEASVYLLRSLLASPFRRSRSVCALLKAHNALFRVSTIDASSSRLNKSIDEAICRDFAPGGRAHGCLGACCQVSPRDLRLLGEPLGIVLKEPHRCEGRVVEKGAILLKYNSRFRFLRFTVHMEALLRDYYLVLEPSWSGYADFDILYFTRFPEHPIVVMATESRDYRFLKRLGTNLIPIDVGASNWVNPAVFRPLEGATKEFDAVMVARWVLPKRHHVLFRAVRALQDRSIRVALAAHPWNSRRKEIELLLEAYGIRSQVTLFEGLTPQGVNDVLNRSKVNLLLSRQEGSNRALFEGFFAGVPGLVIRETVGICRSYINRKTGRFCEERDLGRQLLDFRRNYRAYAPRAWSLEHIAPEITTRRLDEVLRKQAIRQGESWTESLVAKCNCPGLRYYPDERLTRDLPSMEQIVERYARTAEIRGLVEKARLASTPSP